MSMFAVLDGVNQLGVRIKAAMTALGGRVDVLEQTSASWIPTTTGVNKTLVRNEHCLVEANNLTLTLPASPTAGFRVRISTTTPTTVVTGGSVRIQGQLGGYTINASNVTIELVYFNTTRGWVVC